MTYSYRPYEDDRLRIDAIKDNVSISSLVENYGLQLKRSGNAFAACCPFHADKTPSFFVYERSKYFICYGCGARGDVLSFVRLMHDISFKDAMNMLETGNYAVPRAPTHVPAAPAVICERAQRAWAASLPIEGTPAAAYLESRCLPADFVRQQENVRFDRSPYDSAAVHPALVAAFRDLDDQVVALQRVFLMEGGAKLEPRCKRMQGSHMNAAIKLNTHRIDDKYHGHIMLCEGLEDGLTLARLYSDVAIWVTGGTGNLQDIPLPASCRSVTIAPDNDDAGERAAHNLSRRLLRGGISVDVLTPGFGFKDWNEWLCKEEALPPDYYSDLPWRNDVELTGHAIDYELARREGQNFVEACIISGDGPSFGEDD